MASAAINEYINKRYERWLDYARYHCLQSSDIDLSDEARDVLNESLLSLLNKNDEKLDALFSDKHRDGTNGIDAFVLNIVYQNITSKTGQYRQRYHRTLIDSNADFANYDTEDEPYDDEKTPQANIERRQIALDALSKIQLSESARRIFEFHFVEGKDLKAYPGPETPAQAQRICRKIAALISEKIYGHNLF